MTTGKEYRAFWMDTDLLDKALDNCDLGDGYTAKVRQYPHKDMISELTHVIEHKALDAARIQQMEISASYYKPQIAQLTEALRDMVGTLEKVNDKYEIDWADKARLRDFIRNQKAVASEALAKHRELIEKLKPKTTGE